MALPQDGQNANALATVKEVPTGKKLIFVDPTTNEGGVITLEDLTTQILKNLTSQTFALDQGTKTLPAALNELNSNRLKEYNWRAYDDIISAMNAEKEAILIQGSSVFAAATNGGHPYMIILSVPESRDAIGVYVDYFKPTVTAFRYKNDSFEIII